PPPPAVWHASSAPLELGKLGGFDEELDVNVPQRKATFHVYVAGRSLARSHGLALLLHGAGFTGMSWAMVAVYLKERCCIVAPDMRGHGCTRTEDDADLVGNNGSMYATGVILRRFASDLQAQPMCDFLSTKIDDLESDRQVITVSLSTQNSGRAPTSSSELTFKHTHTVALRAGSGTSQHPPAPSPTTVTLSLSLAGHQSMDTFVQDTLALLDQHQHQQQGGGGVSQIKPVQVIVAGHSLGGAVAVHVAGAAGGVVRVGAGLADVQGVVAVDVVEGTALAALENMPQVMAWIRRA
ncbi:unnamed protein product, partial [Discosporangium mesarthrocarpum]